MYLHLGGEVVVPVRAIVAILDIRALPAAEINREFVERAAAAGRLRGGLSTAEAKALVVTGDLAVYPSTIAPATLGRRMTHLRQSAKAWDAEN